ncbi:MAG: 30S ribosomal protein S16 [Nocardioidaceae bacterium]
MAVKIKLARFGKIRQPYYRIVVADARTRRDGRAIETIGKYHPKSEPSFIDVDSERAQYWLGVGAQPTEPVRRILEVTGDWQKFHGLPGAEGTLKPPEQKQTKAEAFAAALAAAGDEPVTDATTPKKKQGKAAGGGGKKSADSEAKAGTAEAAGTSSGTSQASESAAGSQGEGA